MNTPAQTVITALQTAGCQPKRTSGGWSCLCPAHRDTNPSLTVSVGDDGRALLKCHAGCATEKVVKALGLQMRDLMPARQGSPAVGSVNGTASTSSPEPLAPKVFPSADEAVGVLEQTLGPCSRRWVYTDAAGEAVGESVRWDTAGGKEIRPICRSGPGWTITAMPEPRPLLGLEYLSKLPDGAWVYIVEGETCVDAATAIGIVATTSAGGSNAAAKSDWSVLRHRVAVILPDNDEAGERYADEVADLCHAAGADEVRIVRLWERWPQLTEGGDLVDVLVLEGGHAEAVHEALDEFAVSVAPEKPITDAVIQGFQPFPVEVLPEPVRSYITGGARSIGCDPAFIALPVLACLAGMIGNSRRIRLKRDWTEPAIVWAAIIGESGSGKSPGFHFARKAIVARQHRLMREHDRRMADWKMAAAQFEIDMGKWKKEASRSKIPTEPPTEPQRPVCTRLWIEDSTSEALMALLAENQRGLLSLHNELSGWFSFGQYKQGGAAADKARWLQMFDGLPVTVDRKTSGHTYIPRAAVSIAGNIQPKILERVIGEENRENGLLARLLLACPPRHPKRWTDDTSDPEVTAAMTAVFDRLHDLEPAVDENGELAPLELPLTAEAQRAWITFVNEHGEEQFRHTGDEAAAFSKLEAYAARLALVVHCTRCVAGDPTLERPDVVDRASIDVGVRISRWCVQETLRIYRMHGEDDKTRALRPHIELIERHGGSISLRDWQRLRSHRRARDAEAELNSLVAAEVGDWKNIPPGPRGGRPSRHFVLRSHKGGPRQNPGETADSPGSGPAGGGSVSSVSSVRSGVSHRAMAPAKA